MKILTTKTQLRHTLESGRRIIFEPAPLPLSGMSTTWEPTTAAHVTLSNGNLTVTNGIAQAQGARPSSGKTSGKWYFELSPTLSPTTGNWNGGFGIGQTTDTYAGLGFAGPNLLYGNGGFISTSFPRLQTGNVVAFAVDLDHGKIWAKYVAGPNSPTNWNSNSSANPATDTGGLAITGSGAMQPIMVFDGTQADSLTANFGGTTFSGAIPTGFSAWDASMSWDPSSSFFITLSNGNLTALNSYGIGDDQGVKVATVSARSSGKYYFEVTLTAMPSTGTNDWQFDGCLGICLPTAAYDVDLSFYQNEGTNAVVAYPQDGSISSNGSISNNIGAMTTGDVIGVAADLDHGQAWFKPIAGSQLGTNWNGSAGADPATNTGGVDVTSLGGAVVPVVSFGGDINIASDAYTVNFGASAFIGTVPTGFTSGWPA